MVKKQYFKEIPKIIGALMAYEPEKVILFGSMLDPKTESSDIDLFLTKRTVRSRLGERARIARKFLPDLRIPVDFLIYTPKEVERELARGNVFIAEILKKGKVLYEKI